MSVASVTDTIREIVMNGLSDYTYIDHNETVTDYVVIREDSEDLLAGVYVLVTYASGDNAIDWDASLAEAMYHHGAAITTSGSVTAEDPALLGSVTMSSAGGLTGGVDRVVLSRVQDDDDDRVRLLVDTIAAPQYRNTIDLVTDGATGRVRVMVNGEIVATLA